MSKTNTATVILPRIKTTPQQRFTLLHLLDPKAHPLPGRSYGGAVGGLERLGFATYDTDRDASGTMKGWTLTPAGKEKAEALRAALRQTA